MNRKVWLVSAVVMCLVLMATSAWAQRGIAASGSASAGDRRVALVIGNADYPTGGLNNPVNDAHAMARALRGLGFHVLKGFNLTHREMKRLIIHFGREIDRGGVGLFYFAGHGVQVNGRNYLLPVDAKIQHEEEVEADGVALRSILARMEGARNGLNIVILDACRDNPFRRRFRSGGTRGLAQTRAPMGTFIAYATAPGSVAADGSGKHGVYTEVLLAEMARANQPLERVFKRVRVAVSRRTGGKQVPWDESSLMGDFFFKSVKGQATAPSAPSQVRQPIQVADAPGPRPEVDRRKLRIRELLRQAEADLTANRLTSPSGNNALERYRGVLELEPANEEANAGLKKIVARYVDLAEGRIKVKDWPRAESFLARAGKVSEGDSRVLAMRDKLLRLRRGASAQTASSSSGQASTGRRFRNSIGMEFVRIPAGSFMMGSPSGEQGRYDDEGPQHRVTISRSFYLQTTEVTQGQWKAVMGSNPSNFKGDDRRPVEMVSWKDAQEFIRRLNKREGGTKYRLPTEAEWEYACRAGTRTRYSFGDSIRCGDAMHENDVGSNEDNCVSYYRSKDLSPDSTAPVKSFKPNRWGFYDMHGNVCEWCSDWYGDKYYSSSPTRDPQGPSSGSDRVFRGGSWDFSPRRLRSADRAGLGPSGRRYYLGFRVARD